MPSKALSPTRSGAASTALSSIIMSAKHGAVSKTPAHATPHTPLDSSISHHVAVDVKKLSISNLHAKFNGSLTLKVTMEDDMKMIPQKGFAIFDGIANYDIGSTCIFTTKSRRPRIIVEVVMGNAVLATAVMPVDIEKQLIMPVANNLNELSRWNKFPLMAKLSSGKHVQLTESVGDIEVAFDVKGESYWSDSESEGSRTESAVTTPASVCSMQSIPKMDKTNTPKQQIQSVLTPKSVAAHTPKTAVLSAKKTPAHVTTTTASTTAATSTISNDENKRTENTTPQSNVTPKNKAAATMQKTPVATVQVSKKAAVTSAIATLAVQTQPTVTIAPLVLPNNAPMQQEREATEDDPMALTRRVLTFLLVLTILVISGWMMPEANSASIVQSNILVIDAPVAPAQAVAMEGSKAMVVYEPAPAPTVQVQLTDKADGACMAWKWGVLGGHATFGACDKESSKWTLTGAVTKQLKHANGKCLCAGANGRRVRLQNCNRCNASDNWHLSAQTGQLYTGSKCVGRHQTNKWYARKNTAAFQSCSSSSMEGGAEEIEGMEVHAHIETPVTSSIREMKTVTYAGF